MEEVQHLTEELCWFLLSPPVFVEGNPQQMPLVVQMFPGEDTVARRLATKVYDFSSFFLSAFHRAVWDKCRVPP